jgi:hypothetical protein
MRLFLLFLVSTILSITLQRCNPKPDPDPKEGNPVFSASGLAGGTSILLTAGINNFFLATSHTLSTQNVLEYSGHLGNMACTNCGPALTVKIRNYKTGISNIIIDSVFTQRFTFMDTRTPKQLFYLLSCQSIPFGAGQPQFGWDFGSARFSNVSNPNLSFRKEGVYPISCTMVYPTGCFSQLIQNIHLTPSRVGKHTDFTVNYVDTYTVLVNSIPVNNSAQVLWNWGDQTATSTGTIATHRFSSKGLYKVCMEYVYNGDTMEFCKNINTLNFTNCKANFSYKTSLFIDSLFLSQVVIEWTDEAGNVYSSGLIDQPDWSQFIVHSYSPFQPNEKGEPTYRFTASIDCLVSNGTQQIELRNLKTDFAVSLPN